MVLTRGENFEAQELLLATRQARLNTLGGGTVSGPTEDTIGDESLPEELEENLSGTSGIASLNEELITDPKLPEGAEFTPQLQEVGEGEFLEGEQLGEAPQITAQDIEIAQRFDPAEVEAALAGETPLIDPVTGDIRDANLIQAAQSAGAPTITAPQAARPEEIEAAKIEGVSDVEAAQGQLSPESLVTAQQATESQAFKDAIASLQQELDNIPFDPRATVREQYAQLMDFEAGEVPDWARGAVRTVQQELAKRGIQSSTIAGEAITSALMQAALPIASQDAQVFATWQLELLDKRAQVGILRASHLANLDIKNADFKQQAAIENARASLQIDLLNLDNEQQTRIFNAKKALEVASRNAGFEQEAAIETARQWLNVDLANLDANTRAAIQNAQAALTIEVQNLNNRQQAAVENARAFLAMDMSNLDRAQQAAVVNSQSRLQTLLSDQAAKNAAEQFNAQSENQVNMFFAGLEQDIQKFMAAQQLSADSFNASMQDAREQFNVRNALLVEQSNVQWLRDINTRNTELINEALLVNSQNLLGISNTALQNSITLLRDKNSFLFQASENAKERALRLAIAQLQANTNIALANKEAKFNTGAAIGNLVGGLLGNILFSGDEGEVSGDEGEEG